MEVRADSIFSQRQTPGSKEERPTKAATSLYRRFLTGLRSCRSHLAVGRGTEASIDFLHLSSPQQGISSCPPTHNRISLMAVLPYSIIHQKKGVIQSFLKQIRGFEGEKVK